MDNTNDKRWVADQVARHIRLESPEGARTPRIIQLSDMYTYVLNDAKHAVDGRKSPAYDLEVSVDVSGSDHHRLSTIR